MICKGDAKIVHDAVRAAGQRVPKQLGEGRITEIKEGRDGDDRAKYFKTKDKSLDQVRGDFLQPLVMMGQQSDRNQDQHGGSANQGRSISTLQVKDKHRDYIEQEQQGDGDSQPFFRPGLINTGAVSSAPADNGPEEPLTDTSPSLQVPFL